jgi:hypothetical protein
MMGLAISGIQLLFVPGNIQESVCMAIEDNEGLPTWNEPYGRGYDWQLKIYILSLGNDETRLQSKALDDVVEKVA